ncbi:MAG: glycosyltransferase [Leeuwenhoekiella sp.]
MKGEKRRVALLVESLAGGGAERSAGLLSGILDSLGHEVHLITITDRVAYEYSGTLLNLGKYKNRTNGPFNKWSRLYRLREYLHQHRVEVVLDYRFRKNLIKEILVHKMLYQNLHTIYMVRSYHISYYFPKQTKMVKRLFPKNASICTLTNGIRERIEREYGIMGVSVIPNCVNAEAYRRIDSKLVFDRPFVVAAGRLHRGIKQFDKLIIAYAKSDLPRLNIDLRILGEGEMMDECKTIARQEHVEDQVIFEGFVENPEAFYAKAKFMLHCSKFEGFPMVILECLASGTPVVAMDCPTGPSDLIDSGNNGILIPPDDFESFIEAMNQLANNLEYLRSLREKAQSSILHYDNTEVKEQWKKLLENL